MCVEYRLAMNANLQFAVPGVLMHQAGKIHGGSLLTVKSYRKQVRQPERARIFKMRKPFCGAAGC